MKHVRLVTKITIIRVTTAYIPWIVPEHNHIHIAM